MSCARTAKGVTSAMSTIPSIPPAGAASISDGAWRRDPTRSSVEFHVRHFWGLITVKGHFSAYEGTLDLSASVREIDGELEIQATTEADHRELGMTWSPLGLLRAPSKLIVRGRLV